jgi:2-oxoglutarate/2-oxoacid ferredoxin oxidoreductase subunit alpha
VPSAQGKVRESENVEDGDADDAGGDARVLVLGWGSTYGPITAAVRRIRRAGGSIAQAHLRNINPFPGNLGDVLGAYDTIVVPEMNLGQLASLLRAKYLVDIRSLTQVTGLPFKAEQLATALKEAVDAH